MVAVAPSHSAAGLADSENPGGFAHIPALDGIRGAAILLVLVYHLLWSNPVTGSPILDFLQQIRGATYCGVNLFFALSGFLITGILLDTLDAPRYFQTFYARRSLRIFPLYFGSLLALLLLTRPLHFAWSGWQYFYLTYTANLALWRTQIPLQLGFFNISHFWSLQVEEQFYLLWPFVVYRVRQPSSLARLSLAGCALILGVRIILVAMRSHPGFGYAYLPYAPTFACAGPLLRFFGRYSYGLYVFHYSIEGAVSHPLRRLLAEHLHSKALAVLADGLVVGALSVLAALLSYHLFEIQFLRLKRFFAYTRADAVRHRPSEATPAA
jgi:peptidoglycan/LPS O-acetylase OafA/YrhL